MFSYIYEYLWPEQEIQVDQRVLRQKYLVLVQIKDHKIRLKSTKKVNTATPQYKRPVWRKTPVIL